MLHAYNKKEEKAFGISCVADEWHPVELYSIVMTVNRTSHFCSVENKGTAVERTNMFSVNGFGYTLFQ